MKKLKQVRLSATCPGMFPFYIDHLVASGMYGDTRSEVICNLLGSALMEKISGDVIRSLVEQHKGKRRRRALNGGGGAT